MKIVPQIYQLVEKLNEIDVMMDNHADMLYNTMGMNGEHARISYLMSCDEIINKNGWSYWNTLKIESMHRKIGGPKVILEGAIWRSRCIDVLKGIEEDCKEEFERIDKIYAQNVFI